MAIVGGLGGGAMILSKKATGRLISWLPVNGRIITARFKSRCIKIFFKYYTHEEAKDV